MKTYQPLQGFKAIKSRLRVGFLCLSLSAVFAASRWSFLVLLMLAGQGGRGRLGVIGRRPFLLALPDGRPP